jgi:hypothetical protein
MKNRFSDAGAKLVYTSSHQARCYGLSSRFFKKVKFILSANLNSIFEIPFS